MNSVIAGGMASLSSRTVIGQSTPMQARCNSIFSSHDPISMVNRLPGFLPVADLNLRLQMRWRQGHGWSDRPQLDSNRRWRRTSRSNMDPQRVMGSTSGAVGTFSMTVGQPCGLQKLARRLDQILIAVLDVLHSSPVGSEVLARRAGVLSVERPELGLHLSHEHLVGAIALNERVGVVLLRFDIDADRYLEPGTVVPHCSAAGTTEQIQEPRSLTERGGDHDGWSSSI
jgi:hypothetical protein